MSSADYSLQGSVALITLNNPPVNGLGHELRKGILSGLERAAGDGAVRAVVITGSAKTAATSRVDIAIARTSGLGAARSIRAASLGAKSRVW